MKNVALMGPSGAGKTTVAKLIKAKFGYQLCKSGDICREVSQILFGNDDRANLNSLTDALKGISEDILIAAALRRAEGEKPVLIDSIRYRSDYEFARKEGFYIIRVTANPKECISRLRARGQVFDATNDLLHASEIELRDSDADLIVMNDASLKELEDKVHMISGF